MGSGCGGICTGRSHSCRLGSVRGGSGEWYFWGLFTFSSIHFGPVILSRTKFREDAMREVNTSLLKDSFAQSEIWFTIQMHSFESCMFALQMFSFFW